jgi:RNA polymerase sigma-70 factor (ECF subfamily)
VTDWDRIVREHGALVYGTAWRILGHQPDAEDVAQEVFLEAHRLRRRQPVRNWPGLLRRLAVYRAVDCLRQRKAAVSLNGLALAASGDSPEEAAIGKELSERLRQAIGQLPNLESTVFCLRFFEDQSYQDIAAALDIRMGTVSAALHKARERLEVLLGETIARKGEPP